MDLAFFSIHQCTYIGFGLEALILNVALHNLCSLPLAIENKLPRKSSHFPTERYLGIVKESQAATRVACVL